MSAFNSVFAVRPDLTDDFLAADNDTAIEEVLNTSLVGFESVEGFSQFLGIRFRSVGTGDLLITLSGLDNDNPTSVPPVTLSTTPGKSYTALIDYVTEKMAVELRLNSLGKKFSLARMQIFGSPIWSEVGEDDPVLNLLTNLMSYWKMDEIATVDKADSTATANTLSRNNNPSSGTGIINAAIVLIDATVRYLFHTSNASLQVGGTSFTFSLWTGLDDNFSNRVILAKGSSTAAATMEYCIYYDAALDRFVFAISNGTTIKKVIANNFGPVPVSGFHHLVAWCDLSLNTINIEVDNGTADSVSVVGNLPQSAGSDFRVCNDSSAASGTQWDGNIDEVGFWKRALSTAERTALYNSGLALAYPFS